MFTRSEAEISSHGSQYRSRCHAVLPCPGGLGNAISSIGVEKWVRPFLYPFFILHVGCFNGRLASETRHYMGG